MKRKKLKLWHYSECYTIKVMKMLSSIIFLALHVSGQNNPHTHKKSFGALEGWGGRAIKGDEVYIYAKSWSHGNTGLITV